MNVRIGLTIYGILLPIGGHFTTISHAPDSARWQSGQLSDKLSFVLSGECGWPVFPFLIFSMVCLGMVVLNETWAFTKQWVRFGIFSGVIICGCYLLAFSFTVVNNLIAVIPLLFGAGVWLLGVNGLIWLLQNATDFPIAIKSIPKEVMTVGGTVLFVIACAIIGLGVIEIFPLPIFALLLISTPLAFLTYLGVSIRILKLHPLARRLSIAELMTWVTWLAALAVALRKTIELSFAQYSQLPLEPPDDCYVATAAAKGYPRIVGSQSLPAATDQPMVVNAQLATFKAAELTLRVISPNGHRVFRFFYDRLGPRAANMLHGSLLATIAYLSLKPAEWFCWLALRVLLDRKTLRLGQHLYHFRPKSTDELEGAGVRPSIKLRVLQPKNAAHDGAADTR